MSSRKKHTRSKYEIMFEDSINEALSKQKIKTTDNIKKRELSEYNKFIKEHSNLVTGPNRLKKLSKLWKLHKEKNEIINSTNQQKESTNKTIRKKKSSVESKVLTSTRIKKNSSNQNSSNQNSSNQSNKTTQQRKIPKSRTISKNTEKTTNKKPQKIKKSTSPKKRNKKPLKKSPISNNNKTTTSTTSKSSTTNQKKTKKNLNESPKKHKIRFFNFVNK